MDDAKPARAITLLQGAAVTLLITGVSWFAAAFTHMRDESTDAKARASEQAECHKELHECRNREVDDIKARLLRTEHPQP